MRILRLSMALSLLSFGVSMGGGMIYGEGKKSEEEFRDYSDSVPLHVKEFYRKNHAFQTVNSVMSKRAEFLPLKRELLSMWEAVERLGTIVDESDPDLHIPRWVHSFQTAEALRKDGHPRWLILVGFIHDLGKMLAYYGEEQWAVVGDTFPVGCAFSEQIVFPELFNANPDINNEGYSTCEGIYSEGCGFDQLMMSWGHDEYLYQVIRNYVPLEAAYVVRFHSFYAAHNKGAYQQFMNEHDKKLLPLVQLFSRYDLYSKDETFVDVEPLVPYYQELVEEFFPDPLQW